MSKTAPRRIVGESRGDLGESKDEDEVEEKFEWTDALLSTPVGHSWTVRHWRERMQSQSIADFRPRVRSLNVLASILDVGRQRRLTAEASDREARIRVADPPVERFAVSAAESSVASGER